MNTKVLDDIQPKAVMSAEELTRWNALPPEEQIARLRAAIDSGVESGPTDLTVEQIWARLRDRHDARRL